MLGRREVVEKGHGMRDLCEGSWEMEFKVSRICLNDELFPTSGSTA